MRGAFFTKLFASAGTSAAAFVALAGTACADSGLLFFEAQSVVGWSSRERGVVWHSMSEHEPMQKNSVGADWIHRFSGDGGDFASAALQARLAWDDAEDAPELQLYNAYFQAKSAVGDFRLGHTRVAFGLASYWDTHSDLLGDLTMRGVSFDRDWGAGWNLDTERGNAAATFTAGSGMGFRRYGNWLASARAALGTLAWDNWTTGVSVQFGRRLDAMGYDVMSDEPDDVRLVAWDAALNFDAVEQKLEIDAGRKAHAAFFAALYRVGVALDADEQWKIEAQASLVHEAGGNAVFAGTCVSFRPNSDLTLRLMLARDFEGDETLLVAQAYWYLPI